MHRVLPSKKEICTVLQHNKCGICNNLLVNLNTHDTATFFLPIHRLKGCYKAIHFDILLC